jgi:hypothetical protein
MSEQTFSNLKCSVVSKRFNETFSLVRSWKILKTIFICFIQIPLLKHSGLNCWILEQILLIFNFLQFLDNQFNIIDLIFVCVQNSIIQALFFQYTISKKHSGRITGCRNRNFQIYEWLKKKQSWTNFILFEKIGKTPNNIFPPNFCNFFKNIKINVRVKIAQWSNCLDKGFLNTYFINLVLTFNLANNFAYY